MCATLPARGQDTRPSATAKVALHGAGASFPAPLYEKWIQTYRQQNADVVITYDVVGSGEGQRRFLASGVDFGASDAALSDEQIARARAGARLVPVTAGIVVLAYNLPGLGGPLHLSRDVYVDIFAGRIRTWSDPRIRAANPGLNLPNRTIAVVARQDSSGTTFALTNNLSAISDTWRDRGPGWGPWWTGGAWPCWRAGTRASPAGSRSARTRSATWSTTSPSGWTCHGPPPESERPLRRAGGEEWPGRARRQREADAENLRLFLPDPDGPESYPIVTFSWLLLHERYADRDKAAALKKFVSWGLTQGQALSRDLGYIPLPPEVAALSLAAVERIN